MRETTVIVHRARVPCIAYARSAIIRRFRSSFPVFFRFSRASALSRLSYARGISAILFLPFSSCRDLGNSFPRELPASVANWITNVSTTRPATVSGVACSRRKFKSPRNWVLTRDLTSFAASLPSSFPFLRSSVLSADKTRTFLPAGLIHRESSQCPESQILRFCFDPAVVRMRRDHLLSLVCPALRHLWCSNEVSLLRNNVDRQRFLFRLSCARRTRERACIVALSVLPKRLSRIFFLLPRTNCSFRSRRHTDPASLAVSYFVRILGFLRACKTGSLFPGAVRDKLRPLTGKVCLINILNAGAFASELRGFQFTHQLPETAKNLIDRVSPSRSVSFLEFTPRNDPACYCEISALRMTLRSGLSFQSWPIKLGFVAYDKLHIRAVPRSS